MNKDTYIRLYSAHSEKNGDRFYHDDGDDCLCPICLDTFFKKNLTLFDALIYFELGPENLADIIGSIGGGEYYTWDHINILKAMIDFYPHVTKEEKPYNTIIPWTIVQKSINDIFEFTKAPQLNTNSLDIQNGHAYITADRAIGHAIHMEHFIFLHHQLSWVPTGDDTYFDYYPGDLDYFNSLNNWFISSDIRMT